MATIKDAIDLIEVLTDKVDVLAEKVDAIRINTANIDVMESTVIDDDMVVIHELANQYTEPED